MAAVPARRLNQPGRARRRGGAARTLGPIHNLLNGGGARSHGEARQSTPPSPARGIQPRALPALLANFRRQARVATAPHSSVLTEALPLPPSGVGPGASAAQNQTRSRAYLAAPSGLARLGSARYPMRSERLGLRLGPRLGWHCSARVAHRSATAAATLHRCERYRVALHIAACWGEWPPRGRAGVARWGALQHAMPRGASGRLHFRSGPSSG